MDATDEEAIRFAMDEDDEIGNENKKILMENIEEITTTNASM